MLDCFAGTATTLAVATRHGRDGIGCEANPDYLRIGEARCRAEEGLFTGPVLEADPAPLPPVQEVLFDV